MNEGDPDIDQLRKAHRVHLARYGCISLKARPITASIVCDHAQKFWHGIKSKEDVRDIQLHSIIVIGLNLGLRFDGISQIQMQHISTTSDAVVLTMVESIKNSATQRNYTLRDWDGNKPLRHSIFMDPIVALLTWLTSRGGSYGPYFCDYSMTKAGIRLNH